VQQTSVQDPAVLHGSALEPKLVYQPDLEHIDVESKGKIFRNGDFTYGVVYPY